MKKFIKSTAATSPTVRRTRRKIFRLQRRVAGALGQPGEKYFDYFVFNIVNCGLLRSRARHRALTQTIGNARGLDINSSLSAENHLQDLRFHRHQQRDDPNNARGLDNNFASDRGYDSTTTTRLRHRRLRRADYATPIKAKFSAFKKSIII
jgi:hypothetical protein